MYNLSQSPLGHGCAVVRVQQTAAEWTAPARFARGCVPQAGRCLEPNTSSMRPLPDFLPRRMPILFSGWRKIQPELPKEHARLAYVADSYASLRDPPLPGSLPLSAGNIARRLVSSLQANPLTGGVATSCMLESES